MHPSRSQVMILGLASRFEKPGPSDVDCRGMGSSQSARSAPCVHTACLMKALTATKFCTLVTLRNHLKQTVFSLGVTPPTPAPQKKKKSPFFPSHMAGIQNQPPLLHFSIVENHFTFLIPLIIRNINPNLPQALEPHFLGGKRGHWCSL